ncbi:LuxR C-terminal-related transcriptional regulator [Chloroflexota bacterium]
MAKIRVILADRAEVFREGLVRLLQDRHEIDLAHSCSSCLQAVEKAIDLEPDVAVIGTELQDGSGIEGAQRIHELVPNTRIIILTQSEEKKELLSAFAAGVTGYLSKEVSLETIVKAISAVASGELFLSSSMVTELCEIFRRLADQIDSEGDKHNLGLSNREEEVLAMVARGHTNREIAMTLYIAENTVKTHMRKILGKLHVHSRLQAATLAIEEQLTHKVKGD